MTIKASFRKQKHKPFAAIEHFLLKCEAWRSLSLVARSIYVELCAVYNGTNNGSLILSARQIAERMPVHRTTATRGFQELQQKGFIVAVRPAGFNMKTGVKRATEWRLTRHYCNVTQTAASKEFMRWMRPQIQNTAAPRGQAGCTTRPSRAKEATISRKVASTRSQNDPKHNGAGCTTRPHVDIYHIPLASFDGVATPEPSSFNPIDVSSWIGITDCVSLEELDGIMPVELKSWSKLHPSNFVATPSVFQPRSQGRIGALNV